jgi:hypothetical protein
MERKCEVCGAVFEGRSDARCCSGKCRVKLARSVTEEMNKEEISVTGEPLSVTDKLSVTGEDVTDKKRNELKESKLPSVSLDEPCKVPGGIKMGETYLDLEKDLKLDLKKDLGIFAWTPDGIFIRPDITIQQVRNIRRIVEAKHGWSHRTYEEGSTPYSTIKVGI